MNDPSRPDDELVAAVLDGEATPGERARVEADPALQARLAEFRRAAALVATEVPPAPIEARNRAIAVALRQRHRQDDVTVLRPRRPPRQFLAVAAAVLLVLAVGGLLAGAIARSGDDSGGDSAAVDAGGDSSGGAEATASSAAAAAELDLGEVADADELRQVLTERAALPPSESNNGSELSEGDTTAFDAATAEGYAVPGDSIDCEVRLEEADPALTGYTLRATATFAGTPAVAYVYPDPSGGQLVVVVSAEACDVLSTFML
jgi:hypothetical protein